MNPLRWVRWKVVGVLAVLGGIAYFLGLDKLALSEINTAGKESKAARWAVSDFALGLLAGNANLKDLIVATTKAKENDNVFGADHTKMDLSMTDLLRRRYVMDEVSLDGPKLTVKRREDGSINIEDLGEKGPEEPRTQKKPEDWYETAKRWYEKVEKWRERLPELKRKAKSPREPGYQADYSRGVDYPFEDRPTYAVNEIKSSNFRIDFEEEGSPAKLATLEQGVISIRELTSSPTTQAAPTSFEISGLLAGTKLSLNGSLDLRGDKADFKLTGDTGDLPVSLIEAFIGPSLPVKLKKGTVGVGFPSLSLNGLESLNVAPVLRFKGIELEPKDPKGKIAGLDAGQFVTAFNEAMNELGDKGLEISDLKISGSLLSPKLEWGNTLQTLVVEGGKAFANKHAGKALEKGKAELEKGLEKVLEGKDAKKILDKLPIPGAGDLKDKVKDAVKGASTDDLLKAGQGALDGILGGKKKKKDGAEKQP